MSNNNTEAEVKIYQHGRALAEQISRKMTDVSETLALIRAFEEILINPTPGCLQYDRETVFIEMMAQTNKFINLTYKEQPVNRPKRWKQF